MNANLHSDYSILEHNQKIISKNIYILLLIIYIPIINFYNYLFYYYIIQEYINLFFFRY